jgi:hypothetical protein
MLLLMSPLRLCGRFQYQQKFKLRRLHMGWQVNHLSFDRPFAHTVRFHFMFTRITLPQYEIPFEKHLSFPFLDLGALCNGFTSIESWRLVCLFCISSPHMPNLVRLPSDIVALVFHYGCGLDVLLLFLIQQQYIKSGRQGSCRRVLSAL